jgi:site-specific DNA-methyltransferase (adenine-specific)
MKKSTHSLRILNDNFLNKSNKIIEDSSLDLVIADPPYFKVIGQTWDYKWSTLVDYLSWCEEWLDIISSKLRYGGSLYVFGYFRNLAPFLALAEARGLELRQQIIIDKGIKSVAGRKTSTYRLFPNVTESILFFTKDNKQIIKPLLKNRAEELGLKSKQINERLGVKSNGGGMWSIYTGKNMCEQFPTKATWDKLMKVLEMEEDYYKYSQTFNPIMGLTDVWTDIDFYSKDRIHPTEKPYKLIERLILSSSNEGDKILDPFSGSGVTGIVASNLKRDCLLVEIDKDYYSACINRFENIGITYDCIQ